MHVEIHHILTINLHFYVLLGFIAPRKTIFGITLKCTIQKNNFCDPRKILHNTNFDMMHQITNGQFYAPTHIAGY